MAIALLVLCLGLHWAVLQTVAWGGMLLAYAQRVPVAQAIEMTFDGEHPCPLCHAIEEGKAQERKRDAQNLAPQIKLDPGLVWQTPIFLFHSTDGRVAPEPGLANSRLQTPPKPPPRLAFAAA
jgi:hypothetical protein